MKKTLITTLFAILMCVCMALGFAACGGTGCAHAYDNACDTTCNECGETREISHTPEADDNDCTTAVKCSVCGTVITEAKAHTPEADDGDCTTSVECANCDKEAVAGNVAHSATDTDENWTCDAPGCEQLISVTLNGLVFALNNDGESCTVTGLAEGFEGTEVIIPATVNGKPVTEIGYLAFYDCTALESVEIPSSVTVIGDGAFVDSGLTSVTFGENSKLNTIGVGAFAYTGLTRVTIPNSVTTIGDSVFWNCPALTSVTIPASVTEIGNNAFYGCNALASVYYGGTEADWGDKDKITVGDNAIPDNATVCFYSSDMPTAEGDYWRYENGAPAVWTELAFDGILICKLNEDGESYTVTDLVGENFVRINIPATVNGKPVNAIGDCVFQNCYTLQSVEIPASVTTIGGYAFGWCEGLTNVTIPASVTEIGGYAFSGCFGLTSVYYEGTEADWGDVDKITIGDDAIPDTATVYYYLKNVPDTTVN